MTSKVAFLFSVLAGKILMHVIRQSFVLIIRFFEVKKHRRYRYRLRTRERIDHFKNVFYRLFGLFFDTL